MILDIVAFRNKKMQCYANPNYTQEKLENLETNMRRSLLSSSAVREKYKYCVLYHFGTFDDVSGKYELFKEPVFLYDCDDIIASLPKEE